MSYGEGPATGDRAPARRGPSERARLIASFALGALAVLFAVLNLDEVRVNWIIATWDTPLIVVISLSLLVGALLGWILTVRRS
jgi:uncharacterized integral membrane protein